MLTFSTQSYKGRDQAKFLCAWPIFFAHSSSWKRTSNSAWWSTYTDTSLVLWPSYKMKRRNTRCALQINAPCISFLINTCRRIFVLWTLPSGVVFLPFLLHRTHLVFFFFFSVQTKVKNTYILVVLHSVELQRSRLALLWLLVLTLDQSS